jgi:hypothetical protein
MLPQYSTLVADRSSVDRRRYFPTRTFQPDELARHTPIFLSWLAGFVDGEGCFAVARRRTKRGATSYSPILIIANTDIEPLNYITDTLESGRVYARKVDGVGSRPNCRPAWQLHFSPRNTAMLAQVLIPYLHSKRQQAELLASFPFDTGPRTKPCPPDLISRQQKIYEEVKKAHGRGSSATQTSLSALV